MEVEKMLEFFLLWVLVPSQHDCVAVVNYVLLDGEHVLVLEVPGPSAMEPVCHMIHIIIRLLSPLPHVGRVVQLELLVQLLLPLSLLDLLLCPGWELDSQRHCSESNKLLCGQERGCFIKKITKPRNVCV